MPLAVVKESLGSVATEAPGTPTANGKIVIIMETDKEVCSRDDQERSGGKGVSFVMTIPIEKNDGRVII